MTGRDRLRELLDAVLAGDDEGTLSAMAERAHSSPHHFSRQLSRAAGEPPVAMRRRVMLERAAWRLAVGASVTDAAIEAGYDSMDGFARAFARAFGHPPSEVVAGTRGHWLPARNGVHFHPPVNLWIGTDDQAPEPDSDGEVTALMVHHDVEATDELLAAAQALPPVALERVLLPDMAPLGWDGPDDTLLALLRHLVLTKQAWLAAIEGAEEPVGDHPRLATVVGLRALHDELAPRWLALVGELTRRRAWGDRVVDALCDPPETFVLGSVVAHVLTYSAHRRELARHLLGRLGTPPPSSDGDPIMWLRRRNGDPG